MITSLLLAATQGLTFTADRVAVDNVTKAAVATGNVVAVSGPMTLRGNYLERDAEGVFRFNDPTCVTTCTNAPGHTHWCATAALEYREHDSVTLNNLWLRFYEIPVVWLPMFWYPLDTDCGFSWMPGYIGHWGAYLLTKYRYHIIGDPNHAETTWWLKGATRFDLRYVQGVALGEDLDWNLGLYGRGRFKFYFAWDQDVGGGRYDSFTGRTWDNAIDRNRYGLEFTHRWEATERDTFSVRVSHYSDYAYLGDFERSTFFNSRERMLHYQSSGVYWEHLENSCAVGAQFSGSLNRFYGVTGRLPELYFDVNPLPLWRLPINYESQSRIGYLKRGYAEFGRGNGDDPYALQPGIWAEYEALRFDTYHRFTAPFKVANRLSVVPRIGYHGTLWNDAGNADITGLQRAGTIGNDVLYRSIVEGGATFSGRGTAWVNSSWQHMAEPYLDVLAQEAFYAGPGGNVRPYYFDSIDGSAVWEDQFAGRSRNLPYSYYGVTPGWRNAWRMADENGSLHTVLDFDAYAAVQFNRAKFFGTDDFHKLAEIGSPNYGKSGGIVVPGARLKWTPASDIALHTRLEYDSDNNRIARADLGFDQKLNKDLKYNLRYSMRDYRYWDYSSTPSTISDEAGNQVKYGVIRIGAEHQICDWLAWGPFIRWDARNNELDAVGSWIDYLTDCLGFRFLVEYENDWTYLDGTKRSDSWSTGFFIYLRCFGADSANLFSGN